MKRSMALLAFFAALTALPSLMAGESSPLRITVCPYGHTTLTNIPIKYGLIATNAEIKKAIDNYAYLPGGCCFSPSFSPTNVILCTTCKFLYRLYSLSDSDGGYWSRKSKDRQSFRHIFPALIQEFPFPEQDQLPEPPEFSQGFLTIEAAYEMINVFYSVHFMTSEPVEAMKNHIQQYLKKHNLAAKYSEQIDSTPARKNRDMYTWESKSPRLTIRLFNNPNGTNDVHVSLTQKEGTGRPTYAPEAIGAQAVPQLQR